MLLLLRGLSVIASLQAQHSRSFMQKRGFGKGLGFQGLRFRASGLWFQGFVIEGLSLGTFRLTGQRSAAREGCRVQR